MNTRIILGTMLTIIMGLLAYILSGNIIFGVLIVSFFGFITIIASKGWKNNIIILAFLVCFFVFLMGRPIIYELFHLTSQNSIPLSDETRSFVYICLIVSLLAILLGYTIATKFNCGDRTRNKKETDANLVIILRQITKKTTVVLYVMVVIENICKLFFVKDIGYTASFISENSFELPFGLHALVDMAPISLCIFLATMPRKKEVIIPLSIFLVSNTILAISGSRFGIISCVLLILIYVILRANEGNEVWIRKKQIICILLLTPLIITLLHDMTYWRDKKNLNNDNHPIISFMMGVGGSSDLIGAVKEHGDNALSNNVLYSFGGIWRRLNNNPVAKMFGIDDSGNYQTVEHAKHGHSLSSALTYYFFPERYLKGFGLGGCFIAELYHDFSMLGVAIGSILIGFIIGKNRKLSGGRIIRNFFCLFLILLMMRVPRDSFDYPVVEMIGLKNAIFVAIIIILAKYRSSHLHYPENNELLLEEK